jgi:hypothetical protein
MCVFRNYFSGGTCTLLKVMSSMRLGQMFYIAESVTFDAAQQVLNTAQLWLVVRTFTVSHTLL